MDKGIYYNESVMDILKNVYENIKMDKDKINLINTEIDNKIQDILHYIELKVFNVPEGYFAIKDIKALLKEKRKNIEAKKDILSLIDFFQGKNSFEETSEAIDGFVFVKNCARSEIVKKIKATAEEEFNLYIDDLLLESTSIQSFAIALAEMLKEYDSRRELLRQRMSSIEKKINLLLNKIEFSNFGLIEGYKIAKQLKDLRIKRRKIKDEFDRFILLDNLLLNNSKIETSVKLIEEQETNKSNRKYTPRVFKNYGIMTS